MRRIKHQPIEDDEANRLLRKWSRRSSAELALIAGTFVEDRLGFAIKSHFITLPVKGNSDKILTEAALFDGYGPLSNFYSKIDIGFALGIYRSDERISLHNIRSIRNNFAHTLEPVTFLDDEVVKKLHRINIIGSLDDFYGKQTASKGVAYRKFFAWSCAFFAGSFTAYVRGRNTVWEASQKAPP